MIHNPYITVTSGMSGFFAVLLTWSTDHGGFYEPEQTGLGRYASEQEASNEAISWSEAEGVKYVAKRKAP